MSLIINFILGFTVFASLRNAFFSGGGQGPGEFCFLPLAPGGLAARIPGFYPDYPSSIPGQGTKISLQATALCCLSLGSGLKPLRGFPNGSGNKEYACMQETQETQVPSLGQDNPQEE